jgi:hypothetical protein
MQTHLKRGQESRNCCTGFSTSNMGKGTGPQRHGTRFTLPAWVSCAEQSKRAIPISWEQLPGVLGIRLMTRNSCSGMLGFGGTSSACHESEWFFALQTQPDEKGRNSMKYFFAALFLSEEALENVLVEQRVTAGGKQDCRDSRTCAILFGNPCSVEDGGKGKERWLRHLRSSRMESSPTSGTGTPLRSWWIRRTGMPGCRRPLPSPFAVSTAVSPRTKSEQAIGAGDRTGAPIRRGRESSSGPIWANLRN